MRTSLAPDVTPLPVAVVIPAYNAERFVDEALESVQRQTAPPAEVIVVDDGSTDQTAAIARARGVTVLTQQKLGPSAARNTAIRLTHQPWIAFLDADDVWEPQKLATQWLAVQAWPDIGGVFTDFTEFDARGPIAGPFLSRKAHYWPLKRTESAPGVMRCDAESFRQQFLDGNFIAPSTMLVRRDLLLRAGLFDPALRHLEDRDCWLRLLAFPTITLAVVEQSLMRSRIHDVNLTNNRFGMAVAEIMLTERILAHPWRYPLGTAERYRSKQASAYLDAGRWAEDRGELRQARQYYLQCWRLGGGLSPLTLFVLCHLPAPVHAVLRATLRRLRSAVATVMRRQRSAGEGS